MHIKMHNTIISENLFFIIYFLNIYFRFYFISVPLKSGQVKY